ncbi:MAG TPA: DUF4157 domain-containing protein [Longimicrobium sp.]
MLAAREARPSAAGAGEKARAGAGGGAPAPAAPLAWALTPAGGPRVQRECACGGTCERCRSDEEEETGLAVQRMPFGFSSSSGAGAEGPEAPAAGPVLADDGAAAGPGEAAVSGWLDALEGRLRAACDGELAAVGRDTEGCPYLERWLAHYRGQSAAHVESAARRYTGSDAGTPAGLADAVVARARAAAAEWARTGRVPDLPGGAGLGGLAPGGLGAAAASALAGVSAAFSLRLKARDGAGGAASAASPADPAGVRARLGPGGALDGGVRSRLERGFGASFAGVRVHTDERAARLSRELGARAFTVGRDVAFGAGEYRPGTLPGDALIAHELAHTVQQSGGGLTPAAGESRELEAEADAAAAGALGLVDERPWLSRRAGLSLQRCGGGGETPPPQPVPKPPTIDPYGVRKVWDDTRGDKAKVFDKLRSLCVGTPACPAAGDAVLTTVLREIFAPGSDDLWLAETLQKHGPEPLWPLDKLDERVTRAAAGKWPKEPGNIEASLPSDWSNPFAAGSTAGVAKAPGGTTIAPSPVKAYFFPGRSQERALVIGGVHGSEQSGIEVVEELRRSLASAPKAPYFTTILVPVLFPDNEAYQRAYLAANPAERGTNVDNDKGGRYSRIGPKQKTLIEPNRNLPRPGESLATGLTGLKGKTTGKALSGSLLTDTMLPENVMLVALIEHFKPSRIASVHAHRPSSTKGDAPGIYVDPRGGIDASTDKALTAEGQADDKLAQDMLAAAGKLGLPGNPGGTVHYASANTPAQGTSLGDWAPVAVDEGKPGVQDKPGDRPAITTVTVEVKNYWPSSDDKSGKMKGLIEAHRAALQDVFLEK